MANRVCPACGWRGWMGKPNTGAGGQRLRAIITVFLALLLTLILALYLIDRMSQPPISSEQTVLPLRL